jgi:hypothetical protein
VEGRDNNIKKVYRPFRQYLGDVEGTINLVKITSFSSCPLSILPSTPWIRKLI